MSLCTKWQTEHQKNGAVALYLLDWLAFWRFQTLTVQSSEPVTRTWSEGWKATEVTASKWLQGGRDCEVMMRQRERESRYMYTGLQSQTTLYINGQIVTPLTLLLPISTPTCPSPYPQSPRHFHT